MTGRAPGWFVLALVFSGLCYMARPGRALGVPAGAGGLLGVEAMVSRLRGQCQPAGHVDQNRQPVIEHTVLVNHEDDFDFRALNPNDYVGALEQLFGEWTVQSFQPFSPQQLLWIGANGGLRITGYLDEQLFEVPPQLGARFMSSYSFAPQDFSVTLRFIDNPDRFVSNTQRYVKLTVRNASDVRHRAFAVIFRTDWNVGALGFRSQFSVADISDDRVPSLFEWHGNDDQNAENPEGFVQCLEEGYRDLSVDPTDATVVMTMTYHHAPLAQLEVALTVSGAPTIPAGFCTIDLPEPLQTRFRFLMEVAHSAGEYTLPAGDEWVAETTLLQFETDLTYTGQGYTIDFDGLHEGGAVYNELYDQFVGAPPVPALGYYWGSPPLLSEHGVDFGRTMLTPSLGTTRFVEISGHKPINGLLVKTTRDVGGVSEESFHTILSERDRPGLMTQIYPLFLLSRDVTFEPVRFLPNLFESKDADNDGIRELAWNPGAGACPTGGPDLVVDVQDSGFLSDSAVPVDAPGSMAVTYCNVGGQAVPAGQQAVKVEVNSPVLSFLDSDHCTVECAPETCGSCAPGSCAGLCTDPAQTTVVCAVDESIPPGRCGRVSMRWLLRAPSSLLPNSCGSLAGAQEIEVRASYAVAGDVHPGDNEHSHVMRTRFDQPFRVAVGVDVCADDYHCGACQASCLNGSNVLGAICQQGRCQITACKEVAGVQYYDCNLDAGDGCEEVDATQELAAPPIGYPTPELSRLSSQTLDLSDDFNYFPGDPVADELELHRKWTFLTYPHAPDGPLIEKVPDGVHLSLSVEGEDQYSIVNMYSQRRIPVPSVFTAELSLVPYCPAGRCEIAFGMLDDLQEYREGYVMFIDTLNLQGNIVRIDGPPEEPSEVVRNFDLLVELERETLGDPLVLTMTFDVTLGALTFRLDNRDNNEWVEETLWGVTVPSPFYLFVRGNVGSKNVSYSALDIDLEGIYTSLTYSGSLYKVTSAPLEDLHTGLAYTDIPYLQDPQHNLKQGAIWQVLPTPSPSADIQVPLVAVMSDNLLQIHGDRDVNALLVTLAGEGGQVVRSTFYSQSARPGEILHGARYQFPEVISIDRFFTGIFEAPGGPVGDFSWVPQEASGGCAGQQGVLAPSLDLQMSGARPGRAESLIVTTCNAGGRAEDVTLNIDLDGALNAVTVPLHCTCSTSVDPAAPPVACHSSSCRNGSSVRCTLPDLGAGVCVQTRLELGVELPALDVSPCHDLSCDPAKLSAVEVRAQLSWDHPQLGSDQLYATLLRDADCAWDPNVKLAVPESPGTIQPDGQLHYFVFYENDPQATAPAEDVRITDELGPLLDESALSMISRGGSYDPATRTITWDFSGIRLAPAAGGHVEYFVKPLPGLAPGTVIENQASIFFDFNPAMVTEPTVHTIAAPADTTAPRMHPCVDSPLLWPPNHKLVPVVIDTFAWDDLGGPISYAVTVQSTEPESGNGYGNQSPDWLAPVVDAEAGTVELMLRSERYNAQQGRTYTIRIDASDSSGNVGTTEVDVVVPGSMSHYNQLWSSLQNDSRYAHCPLSEM